MNGSRVLGILFANWYSNGNEIPDCQKMVLLETKLSDVRAYASIIMVDERLSHQPVQKIWARAIRVLK